VIVQDKSGSILLGRRAPGSTYPGLWCIPCGYVEYEEEVRSAACREFIEETGLEIELGDVFTVLSNFHNPATHTVGIWFFGKIIGGSPQAGDDLDAIDWFAPNNSPPLAFPTDAVVLSMLGRKLAGGN
jgi:ADP-ribose pyrophosphatase YjhB (NUDIX family)